MALVPKALILRRLHSLAGLWLVLFLLEHLFTNSQAALWLGEEGQGFVNMVNTIHNLPYLQAIEITLLGIPFLYHMALGIQYALRAKFNAHKTDGTTPSLPQYGRNRAFSWQRITSWILLVCIIGHVVQFRFLDYPKTVLDGSIPSYLVTIKEDPNLLLLCQKLNVALYPQKKGETLAETTNFGTAVLLSVRSAFQNPVYILLYTLFVLSACFHAFNGLWTFFLSWGILIRRSAQKSFLTLSIGLMLLVSFLGLAAIYGSWFTLR